MKYFESLKKYLGYGDKISKILDLGNYYGATDSQVLFMIPKSYFPEGVNPDELSVNPPDTSFIFNSPKRETPLEFTFQNLITVLNKIPQTQDYDDCHECDGNGTIECDCCGSEVECKECDGDGVGSAISGQFSLDVNHSVVIGESYFSAQNIDKIVSFLIDLNTEPETVIKLVASSNLRPHVFEVNDIVVVSMPSNYEYIDKELAVKI